jgi:hypothetical protein
MTIREVPLDLHALIIACRNAGNQIRQLPQWEQCVIRVVSAAAASEESRGVLAEIAREESRGVLAEIVRRRV